MNKLLILIILLIGCSDLNYPSSVTEKKHCTISCHSDHMSCWDNGLHYGHANNFKCYTCHWGYPVDQKNQHQNGIIDKLNLVKFNVSGMWNNDTQSCSNISCHIFQDNKNWYSNGYNICQDCHQKE